MAEFKIVLSTKDGKSHQREVKEADARPFLGKKIGDTINGDDFGLPGYEVQITGGSDFCGFPMRQDVLGTGRKRILAISGVGIKKKEKGIRQRKTVCGNTIHGKISQINLMVVKEGKDKLGKEEPKEHEEKKKEHKGEKKEEHKEHKEEAKPAKEEKKEEHKEHKEAKLKK